MLANWTTILKWRWTHVSAVSCTKPEDKHHGADVAEPHCYIVDD